MTFLPRFSGVYLLLLVIGCESQFDQCYKTLNKEELLTFFDDNRFKCQSHKEGIENYGFENEDIAHAFLEVLPLCPKISIVKYASAKPNLTTKDQKERASKLAKIKCNEQGFAE